MFEAKITVEIPGVADAICLLAQAISSTGKHPTGSEDKQSAVVSAPVATVANPISAAAPQNSTPVAPIPTTPSAPQPPRAAVIQPNGTGAVGVATGSPAHTLTTERSYTANEISNAGASLIDAGKMPALIALLGKYGAQAVPQLKPEQYGAFAAELRQLGANI